MKKDLELILKSEKFLNFLESFFLETPLTHIQSFISQSEPYGDRLVIDVISILSSFWISAKQRIVWQDFLQSNLEEMKLIRVREVLTAFALSSRIKNEFVSNPIVEIVWTGPKKEDMPFRNTEQAYLDIIGNSKKRLILVSFAVFYQESISSSLREALHRDVEILIIAESEEKLKTKIWEEIGISGQLVSYYYWPIDKRDFHKESIASLHAKAAISDGNVAFVTSANLTEFAMSKNMELGLLVRGGNVPASLELHFLELIKIGILAKL